MIANAGVGRSVAHLHYVMLHYVMPRCLPFSPAGTTGAEDQRFNAVVVKLHFWLTFIRANVLFFPQHLLGRAGMRGRIANYGNAFAYWNWWLSIGAHVTGAGALVFILGMLYAYFCFAAERAKQSMGRWCHDPGMDVASLPPFHTFGTQPDLR